MATPPYRKSNQTGSGFTNLQRVLQANRSNKLGSGVASGINKAGQEAVGAINQAGQAFKTNVDTEKSRLESEKQRASRVLGNVTSATDEDVSAFEGIRGGQTKAETSIKNADDLVQKGREAQSLGQATGNEGGRFGLLQRYIGGNQRYTGGQQRLDNVLLGQTGQADLRRARVATSGLSDKAQGLNFAASQQGQELVNRAQGLAKNTIDQLSGQVVDYDKAMQQKAIEAAANRKSYYDTSLKNLSEKGEVDEATLKALGLSEGEKLYNTDFSSVLKENDLFATKANVQTLDDFKKLQALKKLSGNSLTGDPSASIAELDLEDQVGDFQEAGAFKVSPSIKDAIANQKAAYESAVATPEQRLAYIRNQGLPFYREAAQDRINQLLRVGGSVDSPGYEPNAYYGMSKEQISKALDDKNILEQIARNEGISGLGANELIQGYGGGLGQYLYGKRDEEANQNLVDNARKQYNFDRTLKLIRPPVA